LSVLFGPLPLARITALRCSLRRLCMGKVVSKDAVRRGLAKIDEATSLASGLAADASRLLPLATDGRALGSEHR
jgi:hypothetical protein